MPSSTSSFSAFGAIFRLGATGICIAGLMGCAALTSPKSGALYRCEQGLEFTVRFVDDSALIDSSRGKSVLYRDAGGQSESQPVYSSAMVRAEFGLGNGGREAVMRYPLLPPVVRCVRDSR